MKELRGRVYVGIDVHQRKHRAAILPSEMPQASQAGWRGATMLDIENTASSFQELDAAIRRHVSSPDMVLVAVDHTGGHYSEPLVYYLQERGYQVHHLEPKAVAAVRNRLLDEENKNDTVDAAGLAYLLYLRDVHGISFRVSAVVPRLGSRAAVLRQMAIQRQQYAKLITQITNRLHCLLVAVFPEGEAQCFAQLLRIIPYHPTPQDILESRELASVGRVGASAKENIRRLAATTVGVPGDVYRDLILDLGRQRFDAIARREAVGQRITDEVTTHPYGDILLSFPCFGPSAAAVVIGVVRDIGQWSTKKKLRKALGVYSTVVQSGESAGTGRMGREGSRESRRALFQVVFRCIRKNAPQSDFRDYYLRQVQRGKPKIKAIVATMGKLAEIIYFCLTTGELYEYQGEYRSSGGDS